MLLMYLCHKPSIARPSSLMVIHAYQNVVCVSSSNPALRKIFGIGLDWIGLLKSDYSYLIKYTVLLETLSSDRSSDPYNFKDGSIQPVLECAITYSLALFSHVPLPLPGPSHSPRPLP